MNVRYDPVSSDMNAPFSLSSPPHADDTSPSAPFLPPLPAMPTLPTLPTLPALPTLPKLPPLPEMPTFAPLKIRHAHRVYITLQALIYTFLFYLCIPIWGDKNSTLFAWLALGITLMVLGTIWQLNEEWMAKRGTPVQKVGVEQKIAATVVIGTYIVGAYTMWVRLESWWLCFVGEILLLLNAAALVYVWMDESWAECEERKEGEVDGEAV